MPLTPDEIQTVAIEAANQVWNRYKVHAASGDLPLADDLSALTNGVARLQTALADVESKLAALSAGGSTTPALDPDTFAEAVLVRFRGQLDKP